MNSAVAAPDEIEQPVDLTSRLVVEPDAAGFISSRGLQADCQLALQRLEEVFVPEKITVELTHSQEEDSGARETLTFLVKCDMERKAFRANCSRFFEPFRTRKPPIYFLMTVLHDL